MKPAPFAYFAPRTIEETVALLAQYGDEAKILAGGQSLVPLMNFRFAAPAVLIDINRVKALEWISVGDGVALGATARLLDVEDSSEVGAVVPALRQALRHVGHVAIRSRGTIGGTLAHADPAAEVPAAFLALDGEAVVRGPAGERTLTAAELFTGHLTTALEPDELITEVRIPRQRGASAVCEIARRHGDFALAGAIAIIDANDDGIISEARLALFGVDAVPVRAREAERLLGGSPVTDHAALAEAAQAAAEPLTPPDDVLVPASYKKRVAAVVARRALGQAATRSAA